VSGVRPIKDFLGTLTTLTRQRTNNDNVRARVTVNSSLFAQAQRRGDDVSGRDAGSIQQLDRSSRTWKAAHRKVSDSQSRNASVGQGFEDRSTNPTFGVMILDDDESTARDVTRRHQRVTVKWFQRVQVNHPRQDPDRGEFIGCA
jgi:hypothetical protein